ncbi:heme exporter protein CcmD [Marinomonas sp. 2405UD68-3]|uniref:heme exporter protein CcmD n=1 Tax=Marinomonas sp. 2405UD68-3 TaxID=3391835 RepID=UPI0039C8FB7D
MAFDSFSEFLQMGRHGFYVWSTYGISTLFLVAIALQTWHQQKKMKKQLVKRFMREQDK